MWRLISDIPPFDLNLAYELYTLLLKPVEAGWKPAKSLIVVTNGALGLLPLSLLPTEPARGARRATGLLFSGYRNVPWLARTHAVTLVPSAAALRTLRQLPPGPLSARSVHRLRRSLFQLANRRPTPSRREYKAGAGRLRR